MVDEPFRIFELDEAGNVFTGTVLRHERAGSNYLVTIKLDPNQPLELSVLYPAVPRKPYVPAMPAEFKSKSGGEDPPDPPETATGTPVKVIVASPMGFIFKAR